MKVYELEERDRDLYQKGSDKKLEAWYKRHECVGGIDESSLKRWAQEAGANAYLEIGRRNGIDLDIFLSFYFVPSLASKEEIEEEAMRIQEEIRTKEVEKEAEINKIKEKIKEIEEHVQGKLGNLNTLEKEKKKFD